MEAPRIFCNPRITSRCKGFRAVSSASKYVTSFPTIVSLASPLQSTCITRLHVNADAPSRQTCASVFFLSQKDDGCPGQKFSPQDRSSRKHGVSCKKNARWNIGLSHNASHGNNYSHARRTSKVWCAY